MLLNVLVFNFLKERFVFLSDNSDFKEIPLKVYHYAQRNPSKYLVKFFFRPYPEQIKAVGFKYMYNQLPTNKFKKVLQVFNPYNDLIIHLKRNNKLRALVSNKLLMVNHKVQKLRININQEILDQDFFQATIHLSHIELIDYVKKITQYEKKYENLIRNYNQISLSYEDLERNPINEVNKIIQALELPNDQLYVFNEKINTRPLSEVVENYDQLKNIFKYSSYSKYFDE